MRKSMVEKEQGSQLSIRAQCELTLGSVFGTIAVQNVNFMDTAHHIETTKVWIKQWTFSDKQA